MQFSLLLITNVSPKVNSRLNQLCLVIYLIVSSFRQFSEVAINSITFGGVWCAILEKLGWIRCCLAVQGRNSSLSRIARSNPPDSGRFGVGSLGWGVACTVQTVWLPDQESRLFRYCGTKAIRKNRRAGDDRLRKLFRVVDYICSRSFRNNAIIMSVLFDPRSSPTNATDC